MSMSISGISASVITQALSSTQNDLTAIVQSLASGYNSEIQASDEYISQMLNIDTQSRYAAIANAQHGINLSNIAEGTLSSVAKDVGKIRELAVQAANGTYSAEQKAAIQAEIDQLTESINKTMASANYNGQNVLNIIQGDSSKTAELIKFQVGTGTSSDSELSYDPNIKLPEIEFNVTTTEGARNAIDLADKLLNSITTKRVDIATLQTGLETSVNQNTVAINNSQSAFAQITNTDYASAMTDLIKNQYTQEALLSVLKSNFKSQSNVLNLLSGL